MTSRPCGHSLASAGSPGFPTSMAQLRHTFGTHAALFGVNPRRLQTWIGHNRIDETMLYVHVASAHARAWPGCRVRGGGS